MTNMKLLSRLLREDFPSFARKSIRHLSGCELKLNDPYLDILFACLQAVASGEEKRLIVNMPPRHLKTMSGIALAAWTLGQDPTKQIIIVSYAEDRARDIARMIRMILKADWFRANFPTRIETDTATHVTTTANGGLFATSFVGTITGQGSDLTIADDPHKIGEGESPDQIEKTVGIFHSTVMSRFNNRSKGQLVVLAHRIANADLSGQLLAEGQYTHLNLPLIAEDDCEYEIGDTFWLRRKGSILRPDEFDTATIRELRSVTRNPDFDTLYQQNPSEFDVPIFASDFPRFDKSPRAIRSRSAASTGP